MYYWTCRIPFWGPGTWLCTTPIRSILKWFLGEPLPPTNYWIWRTQHIFRWHHFYVLQRIWQKDKTDFVTRAPPVASRWLSPPPTCMLPSCLPASAVYHLTSNLTTTRRRAVIDEQEGAFQLQEHQTDVGGVGLYKPRSVLPPAHGWNKCTGDWDVWFNTCGNQNCNGRGWKYRGTHCSSRNSIHNQLVTLVNNVAIASPSVFGLAYQHPLSSSSSLHWVVIPF